VAVRTTFSVTLPSAGGKSRTSMGAHDDEIVAFRRDLDDDLVSVAVLEPVPELLVAFDTGKEIRKLALRLNSASSRSGWPFSPGLADEEFRPDAAGRLPNVEYVDGGAELAADDGREVDRGA